MDKRDNPLFSYAYLDSERLKDTFFSPPKKKRKKKTQKKRFIILSIVALLTITSFALFFARYEFMVIARQNTDLPENGISLLSKNTLEHLTCISKDERLMKKENSFIYLTIPKEKIAISLDLKKPIDLKTGSLLLYLKKSDTPLNIAVVARDTRFFSNSLSPRVIEVSEKSDSFIKVPIVFNNSDSQNTNLYQIKQITIYFYPQEKEKINWALIKDLVLI
ncbi:MAG: hypothetical protein WC412_06270 [Candidatus Omnitrophota bacterium]